MTNPNIPPEIASRLSDHEIRDNAEHGTPDARAMANEIESWRKDMFAYIRALLRDEPTPHGLLGDPLLARAVGLMQRQTLAPVGLSPTIRKCIVDCLGVARDANWIEWSSDEIDAAIAFVEALP